ALDRLAVVGPAHRLVEAAGALVALVDPERAFLEAGRSHRGERLPEQRPPEPGANLLRQQVDVGEVADAGGNRFDPLGLRGRNVRETDGVTTGGRDPARRSR